MDKIKKLKILRKSVKNQMTNVNKWMENHKPASFNEARIRLELLTANYEEMNTIQEPIEISTDEYLIDAE